MATENFSSPFLIKICNSKKTIGKMTDLKLSENNFIPLESASFLEKIHQDDFFSLLSKIYLSKLVISGQDFLLDFYERLSQQCKYFYFPEKISTPKLPNSINSVKMVLRFLAQEKNIENRIQKFLDNSEILIPAFCEILRNFINVFKILNRDLYYETMNFKIQILSIILRINIKINEYEIMANTRKIMYHEPDLLNFHDEIFEFSVSDSEFLQFIPNSEFNKKIHDILKKILEYKKYTGNYEKSVQKLCDFNMIEFEKKKIFALNLITHFKENSCRFIKLLQFELICGFDFNKEKPQFCFEILNYEKINFENLQHSLNFPIFSLKYTKKHTDLNKMLEEIYLAYCAQIIFQLFFNINSSMISKLGCYANLFENISKIIYLYSNDLYFSEFLVKIITYNDKFSYDDLYEKINNFSINLDTETQIIPLQRISKPIFEKCISEFQLCENAVKIIDYEFFESENKILLKHEKLCGNFDKFCPNLIPIPLAKLWLQELIFSKQLDYFVKKRCYFSEMDLTNLFLTEQGKIKFIPYVSLNPIYFFETHQCEFIQKYEFSLYGCPPEIMLKDIKFVEIDMNFEKIMIFQFGKLAAQLYSGLSHFDIITLFEDINTCEEYEKIVINLIRKICSIHNINEKEIGWIKNCLEINPKNRPNFEELEKSLTKF